MYTIDIPRDTFQVREQCDVELVIRPDETLESGDTVEWQLPHSWTALRHGGTYTKPIQVDDPATAHHVDVTAETAQFHVEVADRHLPDETPDTRHGRHFVATVSEGCVRADDPVRLIFATTSAPSIAGTEPIWLRVAGDAPEGTPELTTTPRSAETVRVIAPSSVEGGEPFDVLVVSLDDYDNRSSTQFEGETLETADGSVIAQDLDFTGGIRLPVTLARKGVHRFRFQDALSNAVRVTDEPRGPYWGDIHIHTGLSHDGQGGDPYGYARDVSGLDFAASTEHIESLGPLGNEESLERTERGTDPGTFVTLPANEITLSPEYGGGGHYNFYFRSIDAYRNHVSDEHLSAPETPPIDVGLVVDPDSLTPEERPDPEDMMLIPHHTGIGFGASGRSVCDPHDLAATEWCPAIELYSHHGQSEYYAPQHALAYEFNRYRRDERRINNSVRGPYYAQDFWTAGHRIGAIASSDEHTGMGGRHNSGVAAVFADELTRDGIFDGLRGRQCYATTGERILLDFATGESAMGDVQTIEEGGTVDLSIGVWGTDRLLKVELLRHRFETDGGFEPILTDIPSATASGPAQRSEALDASYEIEVEIEGKSAYYVRVTQAPVDRPSMAWSSPIWFETN